MTKTVEYSEDLFNDVMENMMDYHQTGETVCGAADQAVISIGKELPGFEGYSVVRVTERYVNPWKSDTFLEFSNREVTPEEYARWDELAED